ncbi:MAG TPA: hypothetical protein VLI92_03030, partial [Candidatus Saccharimonadales bacterium]|nr:hypothetical protein [Candidatus Saccharimonadales bacterium]
MRGFFTVACGTLLGLLLYFASPLLSQFIPQSAVQTQIAVAPVLGAPSGNTYMYNISGIECVDGKLKIHLIVTTEGDEITSIDDFAVFTVNGVDYSAPRTNLESHEAGFTYTWDGPGPITITGGQVTVNDVVVHLHNPNTYTTVSCQTPTSTASPTVEPTPTQTPTATAVPTVTQTPTNTALPSPSHTPSITPSATNTSEKTATASATPSHTPSATNTLLASPTASATLARTPTPSATSTVGSSPSPTASSTVGASASPTASATGTAQT